MTTKPILKASPVTAVVTSNSIDSSIQQRLNGFTLQHLKAWYSNTWQQAAHHFGLQF